MTERAGTAIRQTPASVAVDGAGPRAQIFYMYRWKRAGTPRALRRQQSVQM